MGLGRVVLLIAASLLLPLSANAVDVSVGPLADLERQRAEADSGNYIIKFGINPDIDNAATEDVWDGGGTYIWLPTHYQVQAASGSDVDSTGNAGALTIVIAGLDSLWNQQRDTLNVRGTVPVNSSKWWRRLQRAWVEDVGDSLVNVGDITISTGTSPDTVLAIIGDHKGQTLQTTYTVPNDYTAAYLKSIQFGINGSVASTATGEIQLFFRLEGKGWRNLGFYGASIGTNPAIPLEIPIRIPAKSDIRIQATSAQANTQFWAQYQMTLE